MKKDELLKRIEILESLIGQFVPPGIFVTEQPIEFHRTEFTPLTTPFNYKKKNEIRLIINDVPIEHPDIELQYQSGKRTDVTIKIPGDRIKEWERMLGKVFTIEIWKNDVLYLLKPFARLRSVGRTGEFPDDIKIIFEV